MTPKVRNLRQRVIQAMEGQRPQTVTVLSCLLAVEDDLGYVPKEAAEEVARYTGVTVNDVWGVASFYTNFRFEPPGRHRVEVCWGPTCHVMGVMPVIKSVLEGVGLEGEGDTDDQLISLRFNTCLGACANGPVISVDHRLMGRMTPGEAAAVVRRLRNGAGAEARRDD